jgi:hypothetical protein
VSDSTPGTGSCQSGGGGPSTSARGVFPRPDIAGRLQTTAGFLIYSEMTFAGRFPSL